MQWKNSSILRKRESLIWVLCKILLYYEQKFLKERVKIISFLQILADFFFLKKSYFTVSPAKSNICVTVMVDFPDDEDADVTEGVELEDDDDSVFEVNAGFGLACKNEDKGCASDFEVNIFKILKVATNETLC